MKTAKKPAPVKHRPVLVGALAATLLGRYRVAGVKAFTARQMTAEFPTFNKLELAHAVNELLDKHLVTQTGHETLATYSLTEQGRTGRVGVA